MGSVVVCCAIVLVLIGLLGCVGRERPIGSLSEPAQLPSVPALPDPLVMQDGTPVRTAAQWEQRRRELKQLFEHYMYGRMPPAPPALPVRAVVEFEDPGFLDGKGTLREVRIALTPGDGGPAMRLLVATPNAAAGPVPCFVGPNFYGNHTLCDSPKVALPTCRVPDRTPGQVDNRATDAGRGKKSGTYDFAYAIAHGYAVATFFYCEVEVDDHRHPAGVREWYARNGQADYDFGAVAAWAWGISRAVDWLVTDGRIDAKRIAAVGHSRNGKAALVAAAFDERIAMVIPHQSGCGGAGPSRSTVGESVKQINTTFPHWFNANFKQFNDHPSRLPFDQHELIALVAPRPCLLSNAEDDQWANPSGQFEMLRAADPVYRRLGADGLAASRMPPLNTLVDSRLGYWIRPGDHSMGHDDWVIFVCYADKHVGRR